jgi:hypothetical protein
MLGLAFEVVQSATVDAVNLAMYSKISILRSQRQKRCKWRRPHRVARRIVVHLLDKVLYTRLLSSKNNQTSLAQICAARF